MKPFALKFAAPTKSLIQNHVEPMAYNPDTEMMLLLNSPGAQQVIDRPSAFMSTGSEMTKAAVDPTHDEPTDR
jgi:hypothetical protein